MSSPVPSSITIFWPFPSKIALNLCYSAVIQMFKLFSLHPSWCTAIHCNALCRFLSIVLFLLLIYFEIWKVYLFLLINITLGCWIFYPLFFRHISLIVILFQRWKKFSVQLSNLIFVPCFVYFHARIYFLLFIYFVELCSIVCVAACSLISFLYLFLSITVCCLLLFVGHNIQN